MDLVVKNSQYTLIAPFQPIDQANKWPLVNSKRFLVAVLMIILTSNAGIALPTPGTSSIAHYPHH